MKAIVRFHSAITLSVWLPRVSRPSSTRLRSSPVRRRRWKGRRGPATGRSTTWPTRATGIRADTREKEQKPQRPPQPHYVAVVVVAAAAPGFVKRLDVVGADVEGDEAPVGSCAAWPRSDWPSAALDAKSTTSSMMKKNDCWNLSIFEGWHSADFRRRRNSANGGGKTDGVVAVVVLWVVAVADGATKVRKSELKLEPRLRLLRPLRRRTPVERWSEARRLANSGALGRHAIEANWPGEAETAVERGRLRADGEGDAVVVVAVVFWPRCWTAPGRDNSGKTETRKSERETLDPRRCYPHRPRCNNFRSCRCRKCLAQQHFVVVAAVAVRFDDAAEGRFRTETADNATDWPSACS